MEEVLVRHIVLSQTRLQQNRIVNLLCHIASVTAIILVVVRLPEADGNVTEDLLFNTSAISFTHVGIKSIFFL